MTDKSELKNAIEEALEKTVTKYLTETELKAYMLSEFSGLNQNSVHMIVTKRRSPNVTTLCMIAKVLRCTLNDLIPPEVYR